MPAIFYASKYWPPVNRPAPTYLPLILAMTGSILWGTVPYFSISLYKSGLNVESLLFLRYWLGIGVIAPIVFATSGRSDRAPRKGAIILFLSAAILGTTYVFCYFEALRRVPSSIAILLFFTYPALTLVLERVLFKISIPRMKAVAAIIIVVGSGLAIGKFGEFGGYSGVGFLFATLAPLGYCVYLQITSRQLKKMSAWTGALLIYSGLGTGFLVVVAIVGLHAPIDLKSWLQLAAIVVFGSALPTAAFAYSMPRLGPSAYGIVASCELLTVIAIGVVLLNEHLSLMQICGAILVVSGIILSRIKRGSILRSTSIST
jgi:drug/metabolite transporter (DMT)-like permease